MGVLVESKYPPSPTLLIAPVESQIKMALDSPEVREYFRKNVPHMAKTLQGTFGLTDDSTQKAKKNRMHRDAQESSDIMVEERRREIREEQQATPSKFPKQPKVYELVHFIEKGRDDPGLTAMKPGKTKSHMAMGSFFGEPRYFSTANLDDLTRSESRCVSLKLKLPRLTCVCV